MAGLDELNRGFNPKCPHCNTSLDLREYCSMLFRRVLERVVTGEPVKIQGFGTFSLRDHGGWTIKGLNGKDCKIEKRKILRFAVSDIAKAFVNTATSAQGERI